MNGSNQRSDSENEAIDLAAADWLTERSTGFRPGRAEAFARWCSADPRHAQAVKEAEEALSLLGRMPEIQGELTQRVTLPTASKRIRFPVSAPLLCAAAACVAITVAGFWFFQSKQTSEDQRIATGAMGRQEVSLADGSIIHLNLNSELFARVTGQERRLILASGEAHFDVAPDASRPFVVEAAGMTVSALGTAFNVEIGRDGVDVLVIHGRVAVSRPGDNGTEAAAQLGAGERARLAVGRPMPAIEKLSDSEVRQAVAWRSERVSFAESSLQEVIARFNRSNVTQLVLGNPELASLKVGGTFAIDQVGDFVALLERGGDVVSEQRDARTIVLHRVGPR